MTVTRRRALVCAAGVLGAAAAAFFVIRSRAHRGHDSDEGKANEANAAPIAWCVPGESRVGPLELAVEVTPPGAKVATSQTTITGQWHATATAVRKDECDVAHELTGAHASGGGVGNVSGPELARFQQRLEQRFWVTYRRDGAALRVHFPKSVSPADKNVLQMIVTALQVVQPAGDPEHWTALERDAAGTYMADYQRVAPQRLRKRKLTYTAVDAASGGSAPNGVAATVLASEQTLSLDPARGLAEVEGEEKIRVGFSLGANSFLETRTRIRLHDVTVHRAPELAGSLEQARASLETSAVRTHTPNPEETRLAEDNVLLEGRATERLLLAATTPAAFEADRELPARLAALFRRRPEALPPAVATARAARDAHRFTEAFAAAGTTASLAALGAIATDASATEGARVDALNALVLVEAPDVATTRIPSELLDAPAPTLRRAALLSSGALARAARRAHPEESARIDRALADRYAAARDDRERIEVLSAIGNSGGASLLPLVDSALREGAPPMRAAAVTALRLADGPDVDAWIARTLTEDKDPSVRSAAVFASSFRPLGSLYDALEQASRKDPSDAVRREAAAVLRRAHSAAVATR